MMHKVLHSFGDWELDTRHMTRLEKSIYFDARTLYLKDGKPLTDDLPLLERLLMCHSDDEKQALAFVLSHKFTHDKKRRIYRHKEWDLILKNYKFRHKDTDDDGTDSGTKAEHVGTQGGTQQRKEKHQNKVNYLRKLLADNGIKTLAKSSISELTALCNEHKIFIDWNTAERIAEHSGTDSGTKAEHSGTPKNHAITKNQEPLTNNHKPLTSESENATHPPSQNQTAKQTAELSKPTPTAKKPKTPTKKFDPKTYPISDSVDYDLWCDFVDMRNEIKKPLTESACKQLVKEFGQWAEEGLSPNKAISESIKNSWQGVFKERAVVEIPAHTWHRQPQPPRERDFAKAAADIAQNGNPLLANLQRAFSQNQTVIDITPTTNSEINHE